MFWKTVLVCLAILTPCIGIGLGLWFRKINKMLNEQESEDDYWNRQW